MCIQWATIHFRYESQQELNAKFIVNISVTADSSLLSPTGGVNTIPPDTENSRTNNYDKWLRKSVYNDKHTFNIGETIVDNNMNDATHVGLAQHAALSTLARSL